MKLRRRKSRLKKMKLRFSVIVTYTEHYPANTTQMLKAWIESFK